MTKPQPRISKHRLAFAATAAIMIGGAVMSPFSSAEAQGASVKSERDQWVEAAIQTCEKKNEAGERDAKARKVVVYGFSGAFDLAGGGGIFSVATFIVDTIFDVTNYKPINCDRTVQNEANKRTWKSPQSSAPTTPLDQTPTQVLRPVEPQPSSSMASLPVTPQLVKTLSEPERAYIREFKSAMVIRGKQLSHRSRKGSDRGAMHNELVKFMDSVPNDQWDKANNEQMKIRLIELAKIDPIVMQESHRILRKVVADFQLVQSAALASSPTSLPSTSSSNLAPNLSAEANRVLGILTQPIPERSLAPGRPVLDNRHEMG